MKDSSLLNEKVPGENTCARRALDQVSKNHLKTDLTVVFGVSICVLIILCGLYVWKTNVYKKQFETVMLQEDYYSLCTRLSLELEQKARCLLYRVYENDPRAENDLKECNARIRDIVDTLGGENQMESGITETIKLQFRKLQQIDHNLNTSTSSIINLIKSGERDEAEKMIQAFVKPLLENEISKQTMIFLEGGKKSLERLRGNWRQQERLIAFIFNGITACFLIGIIFLSRQMAKKLVKTEHEILRISEKKYRAVFDNSDEGILIMDRSGTILDANTQASNIVKYPRDVILKANVDDILRPQDEKKASFMTYSILKGNRAQEARKFTRNDGSSLWAELNALSFRLNGDDYIVAHVRDITEKKRSEAEKRKLEAQLRQAQKMEALGTLAGGIAHDFNNLLMVIQGRVSLMCLVITADDPDYEHLMSIQEMVRRAAGLTSQLLGFARGGKYEVKPTDLNGVIQKSSQMFGRTKKEITIRCLFQKNIWTVEVDQGQIDQVLLNIYVNAWQAMPEGGELFIQTENITFDENYEGLFKITPGNYVKITIADTGEGMDQETQKRIFEPFFTTKARGTGTGLGLASVYGIIKNHGGFIDVSSEKGKGTRFYIYLPALEKEIQEEEEFSTKVLKGKESILLVDDEEMVAKVNEELLRILGYEVMVANSGKEALEIYRYHQKQIDMIILDMIMPDMSGSETYDHLKELNPDVKVLLSSGYSVDGQASDILKRGCKGFIQKPFTVMQLSQKLRLAMGDIPTSSEQYHLSFSTQARNYHATL